jgi:hypothetical protein
MATAASDAITRRDDRFDRDRRVLLSGGCEEAQSQAEFLSPRFTVLGRDMPSAIDTIQVGNLGSVPLSSGSVESRGELPADSRKKAEAER